MAKMEPCVIEFGDDTCRNVFVPPLNRRFRGRFDAQRLVKKDRDAGGMVSEWPEPVAGQQLAIDDSGVAVLEPLHNFPAIKERIEGRGLKLAPPREKIDVADLDTLLYHLQMAINAGAARIVSGSMPAIDESKVQHDLFVQRRESDADKLAKSFNRLADTLEKVLLAKR